MKTKEIENESTSEILIRKLIQLKHKSQHLSNKALSFPLSASDIFLLAPIGLTEFQSHYNNILHSLNKLDTENKNLKLEVARFPEIKTGRYETSVFKRIMLVIIALLIFFPLGILIYYLALSRRGELKSKLSEIINTSHNLVQMIQKKNGV